MTNQPTTSPATEATVTPITATPRKRSPSAATRKANATAKVTPKPKPAPKVTKPATPKQASTRDARKLLGTAVIKAMATAAATYKLPKDSPLTREDVISQVSAWASYIPGDMDSRLTATSAGGRRNKSA